MAATYFASTFGRSAQIRQERGDGDDVELRAGISRAVDSSPSLRNKKDLIENFIDTLSVDVAIEEEWSAYVAEQPGKELTEIISAENLKPEQTEKFIDDFSVTVPSGPPEQPLPKFCYQYLAFPEKRTMVKRRTGLSRNLKSSLTDFSVYHEARGVRSLRPRDQFQGVATVGHVPA